MELANILVPVDFSPASVEALHYARDLAQRLGATLHVLHVVQEGAMIMPEGMVGLPTTFPPLEEMEGSARQSLCRLVEENHLDPEKVACQVRTGSPAAEIIEMAQETPMDLIIMGTQGRGALAHFLVGSVTERVLRHAPCPLLAVRPGMKKPLKTPSA